MSHEERSPLELATAGCWALGIWVTFKCCCFVKGSLNIHVACNLLTVGPQ